MDISRRHVLQAGALVASASCLPLIGQTAQARDQGGPASHGERGRYDRPLTGFARVTRLQPGRPRQVGLNPEPLERAWAQVAAHTTTATATGHPLFSGATQLTGSGGRVVLHRSAGWALRYRDNPAELPRDRWVPARRDTIYDMASVSKLFTSIVVLQQVEAGRVDLDAPVATYVPEFAENGKQATTIRQLLTHTSGLPPFLPLWRDQPDVPSRIRAAVTAKPTAPAGTTYIYSDLNLITLGEVCRRVTGLTLDRLVTSGITRPLGMVDTGYNPPLTKKHRIAATEFQVTPPRGLVWGQVHDENAWSLDGVAGHAGIFSTATDLAVLCQTILNGGRYGRARILSEASVTAMVTNQNANFPGHDHGLGFELNQRWYMGGLSSLRTAGHTGYTGTSLVIDFMSNSFVVLLTNRVHPSRDWGSVNPARAAAANGLADALRVPPVAGRDFWAADETPKSTSTLDLKLPPGAARVTFALFLDVESSDPFVLQSSADGTTWTPLPYRLGDRTITGPLGESGSRRWQRAVADVPAGATVLRWAQTRDGLYDGRGLFVDDLRVRDARGRVLVDTERNPGALTATGWHPARQ